MRVTLYKTIGKIQATLKKPIGVGLFIQTKCEKMSETAILATNFETS